MAERMQTAKFKKSVHAVMKLASAKARLNLQTAYEKAALQWASQYVTSKEAREMKEAA
jgi:hypothetical protein